MRFLLRPLRERERGGGAHGARRAPACGPAAGPAAPWARARAGRRAQAVCMASPQSCGGSEQRTVRGQAIESCTNV